MEQRLTANWKPMLILYPTAVPLLLSVLPKYRANCLRPVTAINANATNTDNAPIIAADRR